jgi:hypothetical protein
MTSRQRWVPGASVQLLNRLAKSFGWACGALAGYARAFWHNRHRSERQAVQLKPPTRDELVRHLEKFGPEGVQELADAHGIDLAAVTRKPTAAEKRRTHALALLDEGKSAEDVAATKSVNVETVKRWQRESEGMPKGVERVRARGRKRRSTKVEGLERGSRFSPRAGRIGPKGPLSAHRCRPSEVGHAGGSSPPQGDNRTAFKRTS